MNKQYLKATFGILLGIRVDIGAVLLFFNQTQAGASGNSAAQEERKTRVWQYGHRERAVPDDFDDC